MLDRKAIQQLAAAGESIREFTTEFTGENLGAPDLERNRLGHGVTVSSAFPLPHQTDRIG